MKHSDDILISIKPQYALPIFNGMKTVELRRRKPSIVPGARIWIYATAPVAALQGYAHLDRVVSGTPLSIWRDFGDQTGVSKAEFERYFSESESAFALVLSKVRALEHPILLKQIRERVGNFHPPQFFCRMNGTVADLRLNSRKFRNCN